MDSANVSTSAQRLTLIVTPCRSAAPDSRPTRDAIHSCWHRTWSAESAAHTPPLPFASDAFTRQDLALGVMLPDNRCAGTILIRAVDLHDPATRTDSYFHPWPAESLEQARSLARIVLAGNQLTVDPIARNHALGFSMADVLVGLLARLSREGIPVIAVPRRDRGIHRMAYRWGARPIAENIPWPPDIPVDLVHLPTTAPDLPVDGHAMIEALWNGRQVHRPDDALRAALPS